MGSECKLEERAEKKPMASAHFTRPAANHTRSAPVRSSEGKGQVHIEQGSYVWLLRFCINILYFAWTVSATIYAIR